MSGIPLKFWKIVGNMSSSEEAAFRTLIADKNAQFSHHLSLPPAVLSLPGIFPILRRNYHPKGRRKKWAHLDRLAADPNFPADEAVFFNNAD